MRQDQFFKITNDSVVLLPDFPQQQQLFRAVQNDQQVAQQVLHRPLLHVLWSRESQGSTGVHRGLKSTCPSAGASRGSHQVAHLHHGRYLLLPQQPAGHVLHHAQQLTVRRRRLLPL